MSGQQQTNRQVKKPPVNKEVRKVPITPPSEPQTDWMSYLAADAKQETVKAVIQKLMSKWADWQVVRGIASELEQQGYALEARNGWQPRRDCGLFWNYLDELQFSLTPPFQRAVFDYEKELQAPFVEQAILQLLHNPSEEQWLSYRCVKRLGTAKLSKAQRRKITDVLRELVSNGWDKRLVGWLTLVRISDRESTVKLIARYIDSKEVSVRERATLVGLELFGFQPLRDCLRQRDSRGHPNWTIAKEKVWAAIEVERLSWQGR